ncbi:MAG: hypothetical protein E6I20_07940 [Chloroflexi bacterium]|nr:MAG: hypothetical protein E6I20_07940 [Chloroflexota bacterium]
MTDLQRDEEIEKPAGPVLSVLSRLDHVAEPAFDDQRGVSDSAKLSEDQVQLALHRAFCQIRRGLTLDRRDHSPLMNDRIVPDGESASDHGHGATSESPGKAFGDVDRDLE